MFFKLTKVSAFHSGLKLYETLSFFNFFAGGALIGAFRYGAYRRKMTLNLASDQAYARKLAELRQRFIYRSTRHDAAGFRLNAHPLTAATCFVDEKAAILLLTAGLFGRQRY